MNYSKYKLIGLAAIATVVWLSDTSGVCLRQAGDPAAPRIFAQGIISTGHEFTVTFTPDGKEAYFTRGFPEKKVSHVMRTLLKDGKWQAPLPLPLSSDQWSDLDPALSPNGKRLFFVSTRPVPGAADPTVKNMDIWYADRVGKDWGEPHHLENVNSPGKEGSPTVSDSGTLCFFSDRNAAANVNSIYCSEFDGSKYSAPKKLGPEINSGPSDTSPFLSADGKVLLFYSTRPGGYGKADLYFSFNENGQWSASKNLGPIVNTAEFEYNPEVSPDGKTLYFGRGGNIYELPLVDLKTPELIPSHFQSK